MSVQFSVCAPYLPSHVTIQLLLAQYTVVYCILVYQTECVFCVPRTSHGSLHEVWSVAMDECTKCHPTAPRAREIGHLNAVGLYLLL